MKQEYAVLLAGLADAHNAEVGHRRDREARLPVLEAVWKRGQAAHGRQGGRERDATAWAMARVRAHLGLLRHGAPADPTYTADDDLLPAAHPRAREVR